MQETVQQEVKINKSAATPNKSYMMLVIEELISILLTGEETG